MMLKKKKSEQLHPEAAQGAGRGQWSPRPGAVCSWRAGGGVCPPAVPSQGRWEWIWGGVWLGEPAVGLLRLGSAPLGVPTSSLTPRRCACTTNLLSELREHVLKEIVPCGGVQVFSVSRLGSCFCSELILVWQEQLRSEPRLRAQEFFGKIEGVEQQGGDHAVTQQLPICAETLQIAKRRKLVWGFPSCRQSCVSVPCTDGRVDETQPEAPRNNQPFVFFNFPQAFLTICTWERGHRRSLTGWRKW